MYTSTEYFYYSVVSCVVVQVDSPVHYALDSGQMGVKELARIFSARGKEQVLSIDASKRSPVKSNKRQV